MVQNLYSALTVFEWAKLAFTSVPKSVGFVVLVEGVMVTSTTHWLALTALGYLIGINGGDGVRAWRTAMSPKLSSDEVLRAVPLSVRTRLERLTSVWKVVAEHLLAVSGTDENPNMDSLVWAPAQKGMDQATERHQPAHRIRRSVDGTHRGRSTLSVVRRSTRRRWIAASANNSIITVS